MPDRRPESRAQPAAGGPRDVVDWRCRVLRRAGFGAGLAHRLARDPGYDLHALLDLTDRGCPPELAARIVAPLEPRRGT